MAALAALAVESSTAWWIIRSTATAASSSYGSPPPSSLPPFAPSHPLPSSSTPSPSPSPSLTRRLLLPAAGLLVLALLAAALLWRPIAAAWNANLGALAQTRAELQHYDYRHYGDPTLHQVRRTIDLWPAERYFRRALALDPTNPTALSRLAVIALERGDYAGGLALAQTAWDAGYRDRVTRLLYSDALLAAGDVDSAVEIVVGLSHAAERFSIQAWNYGQDGDQQRAGYAAAAAASPVLDERREGLK